MENVETEETQSDPFFETGFYSKVLFHSHSAKVADIKKIPII